MNEKLINKICKKYGLSVDYVLSAEKGYRNLSNPVVLKNGDIINIIIYKNEPDILSKINAANYISGYLAENNFPTRKLVIEEIVKLETSLNVRFASIYNYLPGQTISWEAYTMKHIKLLGETMSNMHNCLSSLDYKDLVNVSEVNDILLIRMKKYFSQDSVKSAINNKLNILVKASTLVVIKSTLDLASKMPDQHPLHLDFVRGNILFDYKENDLIISGILDFEKTAIGNKIFDIARTLAFLLVDCKYKSEDKVRKYFLLSGYNKRGNSKFINRSIYFKDKEINVFEEVVNFYLLYDFYKFLLHNPYESLSKNQHYIRTRNILLKRNVLSQLENF